MPTEPHREPRTPIVAPGGIEHHAADMTVTAAAAGISLATLQRELAKHDQWLPIDGDPSLPLGNLVETNSTGPLRLGYGAWRDLLLGCQFENGRGELITAGGRTVKNVAGYDLTKFMVGQRGTFGRLVTVTTRTYRRPVGVLVARYPADLAILPRLLPTPLRPQYALLDEVGLTCGYLGEATTLSFYSSSVSGAISTEPRTLEEDIADRARRWNPAAPGTFRAAVPPAGILDFVARAGDVRGWVADPMFGIVVGPAGAGAKRTVREAALAVGGSVVFNPDRPGEPVDHSPSSAEREVLRRLKAAFDPDQRLAPLPS